MARRSGLPPTTGPAPTGQARDCPACAAVWPRGDHRVADLGVCVAYLHDDQFFRGWTVLVLKRHATELFELSAAEQAQLTQEVSALLGNQIPHLHWHVIPRLPDDPAPRESVWGVPHEPRRLATVELGARIADLRAALAVAASAR